MIGQSLQLHTSCFFFFFLLSIQRLTEKDTRHVDIFTVSSECSSCEPQVYGGTRQRVQTAIISLRFIIVMPVFYDLHSYTFSEGALVYCYYCCFIRILSQKSVFST